MVLNFLIIEYMLILFNFFLCVIKKVLHFCEVQN